LLFSAGAFALGFNIRGSDVIVNKISMLTFDTRGEAASMQSYVGIFSPERSVYTLSFPGRALVAPIAIEGNLWGPWGPGGPAGDYARVEIVQGEPAQARGVQVNQGAMQGLQIEAPAPPAWSIESDLTWDGNRLRGMLVNRTSEAIVDAVIVHGGRFARLGDLSPGQTQQLDLPLQGTSGMSFPYFLFEEAFRTVGPSGPPRETQVRQQLLESQYQSYNGPPQPPDRLTLIGWMRRSPLDVQVTGVRSASQQTSLVIAELGAHYPPGPIHLPFGSLPVRLVDMQGNVGVCGSNGEVYVDVNSSATLEFRLPEELIDLDVTRVAWRIGGGDAPTIEVVDRAGEWHKPDGPELNDPARFVLADGTLRLKTSNTGNSVGCLRYEIEVEGELRSK
jgi:hypothetical protein